MFSAGTGETGELAARTIQYELQERSDRRLLLAGANKAAKDSVSVLSANRHARNASDGSYEFRAGRDVFGMSPDQPCCQKKSRANARRSDESVCPTRPTIR